MGRKSSRCGQHVFFRRGSGGRRKTQQKDKEKVITPQREKDGEQPQPAFTGENASEQQPTDPGNQVLSTNRKTPCWRVLLAEDNVINQKVALQLLKKIGYDDVVVVSDGAQALEASMGSISESDPYLLILMDLHSPIWVRLCFFFCFFFSLCQNHFSSPLSSLSCCGNYT